MKQIWQDVLALCYEMFTTGSKGFYTGYPAPVGSGANGKLKWRYGAMRTPLQPSHLQAHWEGKCGLVVTPYRDDNTCTWGAIDLDLDNMAYAPKRYVAVVNRLGLPVIVSRSKSGGLHFFVFTDKPVPCEQMVSILSFYADLLGCTGLTGRRKPELFPRKAHNDNLGEGIQIPFYDCLNGQYGQSIYNHQGKLVDDPVEVLELLKGVSRNHTLKDTYPLFDAPPCVRHCWLFRNPPEGSRNNMLFTCAVHFRGTMDLAVARKTLAEINEDFDKPLETAEMENTVYKALTSETVYLPLCKQGLPGCQKMKCGALATEKKRVEYKQIVKEDTNQQVVTNTAVPGFEFGALHKWEEVPARYVWYINGKPFEYDSEDDLLSQAEFAKLCIRHLSRCPKRIKQNDWHDIVDNALVSMVVHPIEEVNYTGFSVGSTIAHALTDYCQPGSTASQEEHVKYGLMHYDEERRECSFMATGFLEHIRSFPWARKLTAKTIEQFLFSCGGVVVQQRWTVCLDKVPGYFKKTVSPTLGVFVGPALDEMARKEQIEREKIVAKQLQEHGKLLPVTRANFSDAAENMHRREAAEEARLANSAILKPSAPTCEEREQMEISKDIPEYLKKLVGIEHKPINDSMSMFGGEEYAGEGRGGEPDVECGSTHGEETGIAEGGEAPAGSESGRGRGDGKDDPYAEFFA